MNDRAKRFVMDAEELDAILAAQQQTMPDPRAKRWLDLGYSQEQAEALVRLYPDAA